MTLVRRAAQKISAMVVRYSSGGCKEWAEGLAREADFIENDWKALAWAMGSLRVLLDRRPAPIRTYDDLWPLVKKFADTVGRIRRMVYVAALNMLTYSLRVFGHGSPEKHVGAAMVVVTWAMVAILAFVESHTKRKQIAKKDLREIVGYYRDDLEQQVNWSRSAKWWVRLFCILLLYIPGALLADPSIRPGIFLELIALTLFIIMMGWMSSLRNARRRLQELDTLLETESGVR